jgi:hypothetical protein
MKLKLNEICIIICNVSTIFVTISGYANIMTFVLLSVDRYLAITLPMTSLNCQKSKTLSE